MAAGGQAPEPVRLLSPGRKGARVRQLQERLLEAGFDPGPIDGIYGLLTVAAVQELQRAFGLREDGLAGPAVWSALLDPDARVMRPLVRLQPGERLETVAARWRLDPARLRDFNGLPPDAAPAGGDLLRVPATYRLAWPRPRVSTRAEGDARRTVGWSRALLAASIPHLSGLVTCVMTPRPTVEGLDQAYQTPAVDDAVVSQATSPFVDVELVPLADLPEQAAGAGCNSWALLTARDARDLALALARAPVPVPVPAPVPVPVTVAAPVPAPAPAPVPVPGTVAAHSRSAPGEGGGRRVRRTGRTAVRRGLMMAGSSEPGDVDGVLIDATGFRLPAQLPDLLGLLGEVRRLVDGPGERRRRLEVVLPAIPAAGRPFWQVLDRVCTRLAGRADRLWLSGFRRPDDLPVAGRPLHLDELARMLAIARESWVPWRLGLVLPAGGWWADGRPLGRQEALALRRRDRSRSGRRDDASGLVMLGSSGHQGPAPDAVPEAEAYLVDRETWRGLLRLAHEAGVGGLAVHPWGEEHPALWEALPEFSGRLGASGEASPGTGSI